jgi:hypothetical protein
MCLARRDATATSHTETKGARLCAAGDLHSILGNGAVVDRQRAGVVDTTSVSTTAVLASARRSIASDNDMAERQHPEIVDPPPKFAAPLRIVNFEMVTWAPVLEIFITVLAPPPSTMVVLAPEPITFTFFAIVRFSV